LVSRPDIPRLDEEAGGMAGRIGMHAGLTNLVIISVTKFQGMIYSFSAEAYLIEAMFGGG